MLDFCFDELGCGSVWGQCSPENPKSEAVMRGADMNPAGTAPNGQRRFRTERAPLS
jgi:RimJ/RimL family protein N-acetyltransferase